MLPLSSWLRHHLSAVLSLSSWLRCCLSPRPPGSGRGCRSTTRCRCLLTAAVGIIHWECSCRYSAVPFACVSTAVLLLWQCLSLRRCRESPPVCTLWRQPRLCALHGPFHWPFHCLSSASPLPFHCLSTASPLPSRCLSSVFPLPLLFLSSAFPLSFSPPFLDIFLHRRPARRRRRPGWRLSGTSSSCECGPLSFPRPSRLLQLLCSRPRAFI